MSVIEEQQDSLKQLVICLQHQTSQPDAKIYFNLLQIIQFFDCRRFYQPTTIHQQLLGCFGLIDLTSCTVVLWVYVPVLQF